MFNRLRVHEQLEARLALADLTVLTHGLVLTGESVPDWVYDMAVAINNHKPVSNRCVRGDETFERPNNGSILLSTVDLTGTVHERACPDFIIFDWHSESGLSKPGTANEDHVAGRLASVIQSRLAHDEPLNLHFIGHSRGAYVNSDVIRRLGNDPRIGLLQMTVLDAQAHPPSTGGDGTLSVADFVDWSDNYYQTADVLAGFALDGAINVDLTDLLQEWEGRPIGVQLQHQEVHDWYHWTIDTNDSFLPEYADDLLNQQQRAFQSSPELRSRLYAGLAIDLDHDDTPDPLANGQEVGFRWSLAGGGIGRRPTAKFEGLDLVFVIDATGSMKDDIEAVRLAATEIVNKVRASVENTQIGIVTYQDYGTRYGRPLEYPGRAQLPLTADVPAILNAINGIQLGFGGDHPETVYCGLAIAISGVPRLSRPQERESDIGLPKCPIREEHEKLGGWRGGNIRKAILLMGDAPPHDPEPYTRFDKYGISIRAFKADPVDIFGVGIGIDAESASFFKSIADLNGGSFVASASAEDVVDAVLEAIEDILVGENGSISGFVYADVNNNGVKDANELGIPNVPVSIGGPVNLRTITGIDGSYRFTNLPTGNYTVTETQPAAFLDGIDSHNGTTIGGESEHDQFANVQLPGGQNTSGFNFGERGLRTDLIGRTLLASSLKLTPSELLLQLDVMNGRWLPFQAAQSGILTLSADGEAGREIQLYAADMTPVAISRGELAARLEKGQSYVLYVGEGEAKLSASIAAPISSPYTNRTEPCDVNRDGKVVPGDVLLLFNALNRQLDDRILNQLVALQELQDVLADVNGDGSLSPLDALAIINRLNDSAAEAEGILEELKSLIISQTNFRPGEAAEATSDNISKQHVRAVPAARTQVVNFGRGDYGERSIRRAEEHRHADDWAEAVDELFGSILPDAIL